MKGEWETWKQQQLSLLNHASVYEPELPKPIGTKTGKGKPTEPDNAEGKHITPVATIEKESEQPEEHRQADQNDRDITDQIDRIDRIDEIDQEELDEQPQTIATHPIRLTNLSQQQTLIPPPNSSTKTTRARKTATP